MTPATHRIGKAVDARVTEFFDGYVLVGFVAGTNEALVLTGPSRDHKTVIALNGLLLSAVRPTVNSEPSKEES
jgi:hypothetical protein